MLNRLYARLSAAALVLVLTACAAPAPPARLKSARGDRADHPTQIASSQHAGVGAVIGGTAGVGIGSLIGAGTGRSVAMVAGAIGGALVGNEVQKRNDQPIAAQQIIVRTNSGVLVAITQPVGQALFVGQRVFIQGYGEGAMVTPQ